MNRTGAYDLMEREYVTAPPELEDKFTLSKIARRYDRSPSSVARMSRIQRWKEKRAAFRGNVAEITSELDGSAYAGRLHILHGKFVEAAEVTLDRYVKSVESGDYKPSAGDVERMVKLVRDIVSGPAGGADGKGGDGDDIRVPASVARDLFGRLEGIARERLESSAGEGDPVTVVGAQGEGGRLLVR